MIFTEGELKTIRDVCNFKSNVGAGSLDSAGGEIARYYSRRRGCYDITIHAFGKTHALEVDDNTPPDVVYRDVLRLFRRQMVEAALCD